MSKIDKARKSLGRHGFSFLEQKDLRLIDKFTTETAEILLPDGSREIWVKAKRGRPPTGFDKTAYMKEYMRKRRAASKALPSPTK